MSYAKKFGAALLGMALLAMVGISVASAHEEENQNKSEVEKKIEIRVPKTVEKDLKEFGDMRPQVHVNQAGKVTLHGGKVTAISGDSMTIGITWGSYTSTWTVKFTADTQVQRLYAGRGSLSEISVGDMVSVSGALDPNASSATVTAHVVKDWSIQKRAAAFAGTVKSVDASTSSFVLQTKERGDLTVKTSTSTVIMKNKATASFGDITVGAKVETKGLWNTSSNTLEAEKVQVSIPKSDLGEKLIQGALKAIDGMTLTVGLKEGEKNFTVKVTDATSILNANWVKTALSNFKVGDTIRVYGTLKDGAVIDAAVVRDISL